MLESERMSIFLVKAAESLAGAESEFVNGRYDNCANRCYYACFQAAIAALLQASIVPTGDRAWGHPFVQAQFAGALVNRRKLYPSAMRDTLPQNLMLRQRADYEEQRVSATQAQRSVQRTREFVGAILTKGSERE
ncbi:MAG: HEPN domain-containing protein [Chloroflexota bacterium]